MQTVAFEYKTEIAFDLPILKHNFILRFQPKSADFQRIYDEELIIEPECELSFGEDSFGNKTIGGYIPEEHTSFSFAVRGKAKLSKYRIQDSLDRVFLYPSRRTKMSDEMEEFFKSLALPEDKAEAARTISKAVNEYMTYEKQTTNIETTAAEAFSLKKGVCQDYAQLAAAFMRRAGIAARYVAGLMQGDGETHAWVEYYYNGSWYGIDPTNNIEIDYGYIKLAHGTDSYDCSVERGCFVSNEGIVSQSSKITVKVGEAE